MRGRAGRSGYRQAAAMRDERRDKLTIEMARSLEVLLAETVRHHETGKRDIDDMTRCIDKLGDARREFEREYGDPTDQGRRTDARRPSNAVAARDRRDADRAGDAQFRDNQDNREIGR